MILCVDLVSLVHLRNVWLLLDDLHGSPRRAFHRFNRREALLYDVLRLGRVELEDQCWRPALLRRLRLLDFQVGRAHPVCALGCRVCEVDDLLHALDHFELGDPLVLVRLVLRPCIWRATFFLDLGCGGLRIVR